MGELAEQIIGCRFSYAIPVFVKSLTELMLLLKMLYLQFPNYAVICILKKWDSKPKLYPLPKTLMGLAF